jgi:hypothetical protein
MDLASRLVELAPGDTKHLVRWSSATHRALRVQVTVAGSEGNLEDVDPDLERIARLAEGCFRESEPVGCTVFLKSDLGVGDELEAVRAGHEDLEIVTRQPEAGECTSAQIAVGSAPSLAAMTRSLWPHCSFFFILLHRAEPTDRASFFPPRKTPTLTPAHPAALSMYYGEGDFLVVFFEKEKGPNVERVLAVLA